MRIFSERGRVFYTRSLTRNEPAYFIFVTLALICLALRIVQHAFPQFVEISERPRGPRELAPI